MLTVCTMVVTLLAPGAASKQPEQLVQRLSATDVRTRMEAVSELDRRAASDTSVLRDKAVQESLVILLERENAQVAEHTDSFQKNGQDRLTEAYWEYYAQVLGLVNRVRHDGAPPKLVARLRRALVLGVYNPDSEFAKDIAREGAPIVPTVLELTQASWEPNRWNGYALVGAVLANQETHALSVPLSAASAATLRATARAGLLDPSAVVRRWAIIAVASARDKEAIPMLERLAQTDPDVDTGPAKVSVRSLAAEALRRLR